MTLSLEELFTRPEAVPPLAPAPLLEAMIAELKSRFKDFVDQVDGPLFKPGDFITPKSGSPFTQRGRPHIVIETLQRDPSFTLNGLRDTGSPNFGCRLNTRVLTLAADNLSYLTYWVEAAQYELWNPNMVEGE